MLPLIMDKQTETEISRLKEKLQKLELELRSQQTAREYRERYSTDSLNSFLDRIENAEKSILEIEKLRRVQIEQEAQSHLLKWLVSALFIPIILLFLEKFL